MPKLITTCPEIDLTDTAQTQELHQDYQNTVSAGDQSALTVQASQELDARLIEEFGSTDYQTALLAMQANPNDYVDGRWGLSHAALTILELETLRLSGASNIEIENYANNKLAYWYSREAIARCNDNITNWKNPLNWSEDSRLDYMTPFLFVEWYLSQI